MRKVSLGRPSFMAVQAAVQAVLQAKVRQASAERVSHIMAEAAAADARRFIADSLAQLSEQDRRLCEALAAAGIPPASGGPVDASRLYGAPGRPEQVLPGKG